MSPDDIRDLFAAFGPVGVRRMFGGAGIYAGDVMFALVADGVIYLKADAVTAETFRGEGRRPFSYETREGTRTISSYWSLPARLYDDPDALAVWARTAHAVALQAASKKRRSPALRPL